MDKLKIAKGMEPVYQRQLQNPKTQDWRLPNAGVKGVSGLQVLPVSVVPAVLPPFKAASLVQPVALSVYLETRHEFYVAHRVALGTLLRVANAQTQPALLAVKAHPAGARVGVPRTEQIGLVAQNKGAIPRTHQLLGANWQGVTTQKTVATSAQFKSAAAGAQALVVAARGWQVSGCSFLICE